VEEDAFGLSIWPDGGRPGHLVCRLLLRAASATIGRISIVPPTGESKASLGKLVALNVILPLSELIVSESLKSASC